MIFFSEIVRTKNYIYMDMLKMFDFLLMLWLFFKCLQTLFIFREMFPKLHV